MKTTAAIAIMIYVVIIGSWGVNLYKLSQCDFEAPYKCEIMRGIGIVPAISIVTVWMDFGK